jgi:alpha-L-rhamnosidase
MRSTIFFTAAAFAVLSSSAVKVEKVFLPSRHLSANTNVRALQAIDDAAWIWHPAANGDAGRYDLPCCTHRMININTFSVPWREPVFLRFCKKFTVAADCPVVRLHVSADERFELFCDGERIARGPDRSDPEHWSYATYDLTLSAGTHKLEAVVCWIGPHAPWAQTSWRGGFILKAEGAYDKQLTTGKTQWLAADLPGAELTLSKGNHFVVGAQYDMRGCGVAEQSGEFKECIEIRRPIAKGFSYGAIAPGWHLYPSVLPDQISQLSSPGHIVAVAPSAKTDLLFTREHGESHGRAQWQSLLDKFRPVTVPVEQELTLLWDLGNYYCAYPRLTLDGGKGATVTWSWAEALRDNSNKKGNRNDFTGKQLSGMKDTFHSDGRESALFSPMWWRSGRWCALRIKTADEPLTVRRLEIDETRYPLAAQDVFVCDDQRIPGIYRIALRGMQMCMHETYVDCPYYEQLMYPGDTRVQMLINHVINRDDRLARRAVELFDYSRRNSGLIGMRYPTRIAQESVTYSLIWPLMLADCMQWHRCDTDWLQSKLLGLRSMMAGVAVYERSDGLLENLPGWSFIDWVPTWQRGTAPNGEKLNVHNNLFYLLALQAAVEVERKAGEAKLAELYSEKVTKLKESLQRVFWDEARGMLADEPEHKLFSEHAQCLALLAEVLPTDRETRAFEALISAEDLARCTVYFSYYLFETYFKYGRADLYLQRLDLWQEYVDLGLCTPMEAPGEARSDCHAWGSHPIYFMHTGLAGITPSSAGFASVQIAPCPGSLKKILSRVPHPDGFIETDFEFDGKGGISGNVSLPPGLSGKFIWQGKTTPLKGGRQAISNR